MDLLIIEFKRNFNAIKQSINNKYIIQLELGTRLFRLPMNNSHTNVIQKDFCRFRGRN